MFDRNHVCPWWLAYSFDNPIRRLFHNPHQMLAPYVRKGMTVMDVGCGMGFFSIGMAKLVGDSGNVLAVDLQSKMLEITKKRARRVGVDNRVSLHLCRPDAIGVEDRADFILAFWMVHEVPNQAEFFRQCISGLNANGKLLVAEPKMHVSANRFQQILEEAKAIGLKLVGQPPIYFSHSALLEK